ncbi:MAG TPA: aromatic amino acid hydroxylase [Stenomitos sp.]
MNELPGHLAAFSVQQHYDRYTPINQAVWRYVMRQNHHFLGQHAHEAYVEGLRSSGIGVESIPRTEVMHASLGRFGWGAVNVDGFIPPAAFMEFQAHGILPIAADMRTLDHISYTPAPDIIHEAAGHAPILFDAGFSAFVKRLAAIGAKAMGTEADQELYEAIRRLSIVKEDPAATPAEVAEAEADFLRKQAAITETSAAGLVSRFYWWTVEYGLIGSLAAPKIYGAGLLSSVGESKRALTDQVKKIPFSLEGVLNTSYDITTYQPQLFVCESFDQLLEAAEELETYLSKRPEGVAEATGQPAVTPRPAGPAKEPTTPVVSEAHQRDLQELYRRVRALREDATSEPLEGGLREVWRQLDAQYPADWLLRLEMLELASERKVLVSEQGRLWEQLKALETDAEKTELIEEGLALI